MTKSLETATRKKIDSWLKDFGWNIDEDNKNCNVFTERAKTKEQNNKFKGKFPDYVLYKSGTDEPIAIIEAKKKGQSIEKALNQAIEKYANPLGIHIVFAIDGTFVRSWDLRTKQELSIDKELLKELISEERLIRFLEEGSDISEVTAEVKYTREELIRVFKWANELLRKEGIQKGLDRFTEFSNLLFIKIISEIEEDREKRGVKARLDKSIRWESFCNEPDSKKMLHYINDTVLKNGLAKEYNRSDDIFRDKLQIQNPNTVKDIVKKLSELTLLNTESEIKGDAFEYFLKSLGGSNDLGEYFTPRHIVKTMVELIHPKFGNTIFDPFCGTGGFLIEVFRHIKKGIDEDDQKLMEVLKKKSIFGVELTNTYKIAKMNMIITGDGHNNIIRDDTAKEEYWDKFIGKEDGKEKEILISKLKKEGFDIIISNMPYSQPTDYGTNYPIPSNQGDSIFIQHMIMKLKNGGKCAVIIPEGFLFKGFHKKTREYLLQECELEAIISLPNGVFLPYANVKTNIIIFKKGKPTQKVWFFDVENDGFELNTNRKRIQGKNDLDLVLEIWDKRQEYNDGKKYFWIDIEKIKRNDFNLSLSKYKKFAYKDREIESPDKIINKILEAEENIKEEINDIKSILK